MLQPKIRATAYAVIPPRNAKTDLLAIENVFSTLHYTRQRAPIAFELWGEPDRLRFIVRSPIPELAENAANKVRAVWSQAIVRPLYDDEDPAYPLERDPATARIPLVYELRFREAPYLPIRTHLSREGRSTYDDLSRQADPLVGVFNAISSLEQDEYAAIQYTLLPADDIWGRIWRGSEQDISRRLTLIPPFIFRTIGLIVGTGLLAIAAVIFTLFFLFSDSTTFLIALALLVAGSGTLILSLRIPPPPRPEIVSQKIASSAFFARIRLFVWASPTRAQLIMDHLLASFSGYGFPAGNAFVPIPLPSTESILQVAVNVPLVQKKALFLSTIFFGKKQLPIVTAAEMAYLWHLPHESIYIPKLEYATSRILSPASRDFFRTDGIYIGMDPLSHKPVYLPRIALRGHVGLVGASQSGKTNMMIQLTSALLNEPDAAVVVIDPHGTLARGLLPHIPFSRLDKTIYIDLGNTQYAIGLNLIDQSNRDDDDAIEGKLLSDVVSSLRQIWTDSWGPRMEDYLRGALTILIAANQMLQREYAWVQFAIRTNAAIKHFLQASTAQERRTAYQTLLGVLRVLPERSPGSRQARIIAEYIRLHLESLNKHIPPVTENYSPVQQVPTPTSSFRRILASSTPVSRSSMLANGAESVNPASGSPLPNLESVNEFIGELQQMLTEYLDQINAIAQHFLAPQSAQLPHDPDPFLVAYVARTIYAPDQMLAIRDRPIQFSLLDVPALLMQERFANLVMNLLSRSEHPHAVDWMTRNVIELKTHQLNTYREYITPVVTKINAFINYEQARRILGQSESTLSIKTLLNNGGVLIINLASGVIGRDAADLIGSTIINHIAAHLFARQRHLNKMIGHHAVPPSPLYLVVDEFQTISGGNFAMLLSEAAKFGLRLIMGTQSLSLLRQRRDDRYIPWLENVRTLFGFRISSEDAHVAKEFNVAGGENSMRVSEEDLVGLPDYHCMVRAHDLEGRPNVFAIRTQPATPPHENVERNLPHRIIENSIRAVHRPGHEIDVEVSSFFQLQAIPTPMLGGAAYTPLFGNPASGPQNASSSEGAPGASTTRSSAKKRQFHNSLFE